MTDMPAARAATATSYVQPIGKNGEYQQKLDTLLDPTQTGWSTEAINDQAGKRLKELAKFIEQANPADEPKIAGIVSDDVRCTALRPELVESYRNDSISVFRQAAPVSGDDLKACSSAELLSRLRKLRSAGGKLEPSAGSGSEYHVKFKIVSVNPSANIATDVYVEGSGLVGENHLQWRANWQLSWTGSLEDLRIASVTVNDYEETLSESDRPWMVDCTSSVLRGDASLAHQFSRSMEHWVRHIESPMRINRLGHNGISLGDFNGDDRDDLYVCQPGGLPNRLYIAQPDGTAVECSSQLGVDYLDDSTCALWVDLDNDGDQDLVVMTVAGGLLLENDGGENLRLRQHLANCRNAFSLTAADYDLDSRLDLYVGRYWPTSEERGDIPLPVPYYDATNGGANLLLRNQGNLKFDDVTDETGLGTDNNRFTMAAAWADVDDDGDDDLYVANDFGKNCLYRNDGGKFTNIALQAGVEDAASGMSVSFGDYDSDGRLDIYVSNMFSSAGNRITYQRQYSEQFDDDSVKSFQHMARGNTLFRNLGDGTFEDVSQSARVTMGRWAWGSIFADINNDSNDDLLVLNGNISTERPGDL